MNAVFRTMAILIEQPPWAAVPGVVYLLLFLRVRNRLLLAAAVAWLLYLPYEYAMKLRILCSGECNIRVDLLLIYPALLLLSLAAAFVLVKEARRGRE